MAKKIDTSELLEKQFISNNYGEFTVLEYLGKETDYMYKIVFTETSNEETVTRKSIIALSCVDKKKKDSAFDILKEIRSLDPNSDKGMFLIACLVRGGVYSEGE